MSPSVPLPFSPLALVTGVKIQRSFRCSVDQLGAQVKCLNKGPLLLNILFLAYLLCWTKMTGNLWLQNWMEIHWSLATKNCKISLRNRRSHSENRGMEEVVKLRSFFRLSLTRQMGQTIIDGIKSFEVANLYYYFDPRSYFDRAEIQQLKSQTNGHPLCML